MEVYLDDQPTDLPGDTLGAVVREAVARLQGQGRIVMEIQLDGEVVEAQAMDAEFREPAAGREVRIYSTEPRELALTTLRQVQARLSEAGEQQTQAADLLQQDNLPAAMAALGEALAIWQQANMAVLQTSQLVGVDLDRQTFEGQPVVEVTSHLARQLREVSEMLQAGDTVALADALAYEWPELAQQWSRLIDALMAWIEQA